MLFRSALAAKALKATGIGAIVADLFSRTFYRNGHEMDSLFSKLAAYTT